MFNQILDRCITGPLTLILGLVALSRTHCSSSKVDYMSNTTWTIQVNSQRIMELDTRLHGSRNAGLNPNRSFESSVSTYTPGLMLVDMVSYLVCHKSLISIIDRDIVRVLRLVEISLTIFTVPLQNVAEGVLTHQTIPDHIVSIHL